MRLACFAILVAFLGTTACAGPRKVTRTAGDSIAGSDLSGYWNDRDAQEIAKVMIQDCMSRPWASIYQEENGGKRPVVKLMGVSKRTDDRNVNEDFFTKRLEEELMNSGRVRVVAGYGLDNVNVVERNRQAVHGSDETAKSHGNETGADFTLQTTVNSQNETDGGGKAVRAYLVTMELVSVSTNEKVWQKGHTIRKVVDQAGTSW